ncbi:uncharacterized protein ARMOST_18797 [Armillaria ostoyae]|uniref:Heterokaryon incompatibility domain-containing protein n=1 Tax=Armillaria ostoyae TaxID=47428 RepID=A0A284S2U4_ARMOS|nr:uncharacterized protein ARMOST_18797 [Armillaria ostoyae]
MSTPQIARNRHFDKFHVYRLEWNSRYYKDATDLLDWDKQAHLKYDSLPEVTLSASTKIGQAELSIALPNQCSYTGRKPVILSSLADIPCVNLGVTKLLEKLNTILGTSYTLQTLSLSSLLKVYINKGYDFGTIYAHLCPVWYNNLTIAEHKLYIGGALDQEMRRDVFFNQRIVDYEVPPRRVWDLCSNRVVPWWVARQWPTPISHVWMEEEDRTNVLTPINGREWPVPIPKDGNLDLIRIEMLSLGVEYAWLDVLCLRQAGGPREDLRAEKWKVDVPTTGHVYTWTDRVACYCSGLGLPSGLKAVDFESNRSWFRQAWTFQEIKILAHENPGELMICGGTDRDEDIEGDLQAIKQRLSSLQHMLREGSLFDLLLEMQKWVSTNPVDKVAGLAYFVRSDGIPAYYETQSLEDAWTELICVMCGQFRAALLFLYSKSGSGSKHWRPSWTQVTTETEADLYKGPWIESGYVCGLDEGSREGKNRHGELTIEDYTGARHTFNIVADHQYPIPDNKYTLLGSETFDYSEEQVDEQYWIVGRQLSEQKFEKISVFRLPCFEEVKRLYDLGVATKAEVALA